MVAIRTETDDNVIKHFTSDQKKIYDEWHDRKAKTMSEATYNDEMAKLEAIFASMCGKTLLLAEYVMGEIKCPRCGKINQLNITQREEHIKRTSE